MFRWVRRVERGESHHAEPFAWCNSLRSLHPTASLNRALKPCTNSTTSSLPNHPCLPGPDPGSSSGAWSRREGRMACGGGNSRRSRGTPSPDSPGDGPRSAPGRWWTVRTTLDHPHEAGDDGSCPRVRRGHRTGFASGYYSDVNAALMSALRTFPAKAGTFKKPVHHQGRPQLSLGRLQGGSGDPPPSPPCRGAARQWDTCFHPSRCATAGLHEQLGYPSEHRMAYSGLLALRPNDHDDITQNTCLRIVISDPGRLTDEHEFQHPQNFRLSACLDRAMKGLESDGSFSELTSQFT